MSNAVLDFVRSRDPELKKADDDDLTLFLGDRDPGFLDDPQFAKRYGLVKQKRKAEGGSPIASFIDRAVDYLTPFVYGMSPWGAADTLAKDIGAVGQVAGAATEALAKVQQTGSFKAATTPLPEVEERVIVQAARGAGELTPALGAMAVGVPAPVALGGGMAANEYARGGDPVRVAKAAGLGLAFPATGAIGSEGGGLLASRVAARLGLGETGTSAAMTAGKVIGAQSMYAALMVAGEAGHFAELLRDDPEKAREELTKVMLVNLVFELPRVPQLAREALARDHVQAWFKSPDYREVLDTMRARQIEMDVPGRPEISGGPAYRVGLVTYRVTTPPDAPVLAEAKAVGLERSAAEVEQIGRKAGEIQSEIQEKGRQEISEEGVLKPPAEQPSPKVPEAVEPVRSEISEKQITDLAESKKIPWDYDPAFMDFTQQLTGKRHLSELSAEERAVVYEAVKAQPAEVPKSEMAATELLPSEPPLKQTPFDTSKMTSAEKLRHEAFIEGTFGENKAIPVTETPLEITAKAQAEITDTAQTEGKRPAKEIKSELVARLEKAMAEAPSEIELAKIVNKLKREPTTGEQLSIREQQTKIEIFIPGDGTFTIFNTKEALGEILRRAKRISTSTEPPKGFTERKPSRAEGQKFLEEAKVEPPPATPAAPLESRGEVIPKFTEATNPLGKAIAEDVKKMAGPEPTLGIAPAGSSGVQRVISTIREIGKAALSIPRMNDFRRSILDWSSKLQKSFGEIREAQKAIRSIARKPVQEQGITNWIEAAGDDAVLAGREAASPDPKLKAGYTAARKLTPEQIKLATEIKTAFDALYARGQHYDIIDSFRENYTPHIWNLGLLSRLTRSSRTLTDQFRFSKARTFDTFFDGEMAGYKPKTKDISKLLPVYIHEMNNAIAAKQLVESLSKGVASDGRPLVSPRGMAKVLENDASKATLVFPKAVRDVDTRDYRVLPQPALQDWRWVSKDDAGHSVFLKSDLALHPEAFARLRNVLGQSEIRNWYNTPTTTLAEIPKLLAKGLDTAQAEAKRTMLGFLSTFHQVQEGTHAVGHKVNPFTDIPKIDLARNPSQMDAARHGLMLNPDRISERYFMEGVGQTGLMSRVPIVGRVADAYADYLFHSYIPGLKFKTYSHILDRNMKRYADDITAGKVGAEDVKLLSAEQTNAAFGHLNYADMARNPTMQHVLQLGLLAPDFLEARGRFAAQAGKALLGAKAGNEQLAAIALLAALQFGTTRVINKLADDDWHFDHPFEVVAGGRRYVLRSVPEDIYNLVRDTRQFAYGRMNPIVMRGTVQGLTGLNYRGEKVTSLETLGELLATYIPITVRWLPGLRGLTETSRNRPVSPLEEFAGTMGMRISRYSPITEVYKLAADWKEKEDVEKDRGTYPISKYQQLRYALEDADLARARAEYDKLIATGLTRLKLNDGFRASINHPFTGSLVNDRKFRESLDENGKLMFDRAVAMRKDIIVKFIQVMRNNPPEPRKE